MNIQDWAWVATIFASAGQFVDCYTTYKGVVINKTDVEGNTGWMNNFLIKHPWALLTLKPLGMLAGLGFLTYFGVKDSIPSFEALAILCGILFGAEGLITGLTDWL